MPKQMTIKELQHVEGLADQESSNIIDMKTEGIKTDGTDAAANIQVILDKYGEGYKYIFPEGTYTLETYIDLPSNSIIEGIKGKTIFKAKDASLANPVLVSVNTKTNIIVDAIVFDGNITNLTTFENVITVYKSSHVKFTNCVWQETKGIAIIFSTEITYSGVEDSYFYNCGITNRTSADPNDRKQAIAFSSGSVVLNYGNFVLNNSFEEVGLDCISMSSQNDGKIFGNYIKHNDSGSIYISNSNFVKVTNNHVWNSNVGVTTGGNGIDVANECANIVITSNVCVYNGGAGIMVSDINDCVISNNVCMNNYQDGTGTHKAGITVHSASTGVQSSDIIIVNNICRDLQGVKTQEYGIQWVEDLGTLTRLHIDKNNNIGGNNTSDLTDNLILNEGNVYDVSLAAGASVRICKSDVYAILDIVRYNDSKVATIYFRIDQTPIELEDYGNVYEVTDIGTEVAVYYDSGTSSFILKNKTALTRNFRYSLRMT